MLYLVILLILVAVVSVATIYVIGEPGYIYLQWSDWQVETSLILVLAAIFLIVLVLYVFFEFVVGILGIPRRVGRSYREYRDAKRQIKTGQGFKFLLLGDWSKAEKLLDRAAKNHPEPVFNYLAAAYSAHKRGDSNQRELFLGKAKENGEDYKHIVSLANCRFQIAQGEYLEAVEELKKLCSYLPNNPIIFRLLAETYQKLGDWASLEQLRPHLLKSQAFSSEEFRTLFSLVLQYRLKSAESSSELLKIWKAAPTPEQNNPDIAAVYVRKLLEFDRHQEAEKVIRNLMTRNWNSELAYLYGLIGGNLKDRSLYDTALRWTNNHSDDSDLLLTMGKLAIRNDLPAKAQEYLEASAKNGGRPEAIEQLGKLLEDQNKKDDALDVYRNAMSDSRR